jgi:hypothetical protein
VGLGKGLGLGEGRLWWGAKTTINDDRCQLLMTQQLTAAGSVLGMLPAGFWICTARQGG